MKRNTPSGMSKTRGSYGDYVIGAVERRSGAIERKASTVNGNKDTVRKTVKNGKIKK